MERAVQGEPKLNYIQCYGSSAATIDKTNEDATDPRFGMPEIYQISPATLTTATAQKITSQTSLKVHWTRIIHLVEDNLESEVIGTPRLQVPYNRLKDIEKILGGSAEMFWRGARPGYQASIDPDANWDIDDPSLAEMREQLEEYENNLRRMLFTQGIDLKAIEMQIANPLDHLKAQLEDVAAATNIPLRILVGTEEGRLAGAQDSEHWDDYVSGRRREWAEPVVIRPFIDRLIKFKALPEPQEGNYNVIWPDLRTPSDKEKAEVGRIRSEALNKYLMAPGADSVIPIDQAIQHLFGLDEDAARDIIEDSEIMIRGEIDEREEENETAKSPGETETPGEGEGGEGGGDAADAAGRTAAGGE
jgi:hypothetical protein